MNYRLASRFLVRLSGFSFSRLERLRFPKTIAAVAGQSRAAEELGVAGSELGTALDAIRFDQHPAFLDPAAGKQLRRAALRLRPFATTPTSALPAELLNTVEHALPELAPALRHLRDAHTRWTEATKTLSGTFDEELEEKRAVFHETFANDARLREAVFLESPNAFTGITSMIRERGPRNARARGRERTAIMYLQRFAAKNDTNSMCGPFGIGSIKQNGETTELELVRELELRKTYFSFWAAQALHRALSEHAGLEETLRLSKNPTARVSGSALAFCAIEHDATTAFTRRWARAKLAEKLVELVRAFESPQTIAAAVNRVASEELDEDQARATIEELIDQGVLLSEPSLPIGLFDPLATLAGELDVWPDSEKKRLASEKIAAFRALVEDFSNGGLERRIEVAKKLGEEFEQTTRVESERGQGRHYSDRGLLHEDCYASTRAEISGAHAAELTTRLGMLTSAASLPLELARERVRSWFAAKFGEGRSVAAVDVHRAFDEDKPYLRACNSEAEQRLLKAIDAVRAVFGRAISASIDGVATISPAELEAALARVPFADRKGYASADLMLIPRAGASPSWVLGEMHGFYMLPTFWFDVAPEKERDEALDELRAVLDQIAAGRETLEPLFLHTQATDRRFPLAKADLRMIGAGGRTPSYDFADLEMSLENGELHFEHSGREVVPVMLYSTYPFFSYCSPVAPLLDEFSDKFLPEVLLPSELVERESPRMMLGDLIFKRRIWIRTARELLIDDGELEIFAGVQRVRKQLGCPRCVFASIPGEPKPVLLDFDDFFLVEAFMHTLKRIDPNARIKLSEMLPGPDDLFLQGEDGPRTFELRMGLFRV